MALSDSRLTGMAVGRVLADMDSDAAEDYSREISRLARWLSSDDLDRLACRHIWANFC
jgi:hypothetical protein